VITPVGLLVFARLAGFLSKAPGFSHPSVPGALRAALAAVLAALLAPALARPPRLHPLAGELILAMILEFAVGASIGYGTAVLIEGAYAGGRLLDDYVGIRGSVPTIAIAGSTGLGRLWSSVFVAAFFLLNGHLAVLAACVDSFRTLPPGMALDREAFLRFAVALPAAIARAALLVAGPALVLTAAIQVGLAAISRVVPRFSSFTLPFPIVFGAVVLITLATMPLLAPLAATPLRYATGLQH
jgi:flagellar biosynthetic protein FliR